MTVIMSTYIHVDKMKVYIMHTWWQAGQGVTSNTVSYDQISSQTSIL